MSAFVQTFRAEAFKTVRKRRTFVLAGLWWGLLPILTLIVARVIQVNVGDSFMDEAGGVAEVLQTFASPYGLAQVALSGPAFMSPTFYIIAIALLAALYLGEERNLSMWKTTLVAQPSRLAVLWGKLAMMMAVLGILMAGALVAAVAFGWIGTIFLPTDGGGDWGRLLALYGLQWLNAAGAVAFAALMIFLIRSTALGIVAIFFLPALLEGLYSVWRATVGFQPVNQVNAVFQALRLRQTLEDLPRYFFTNNLYLPAREPARRLTEAFGAETGGADAPFASMLGSGLGVGHALTVMAVYAVLFAGILTWSFLRRDVD